MTEPNKLLEQMTAQERLDLGISYLGESRFDEAIKALSSIRREEADPGTYAQAQLGLGLAYKAQGKLDDAIAAWKKVREDIPETYADAQLNLGLAYAKSGKREQSIEALSSIRREEAAPETYARAQFNLGVAYAESGERKQAIKILSNIRREEADPGTYAQAQLNLGLAYAESGEWKQAIKTWSKVRHEDDPKVYALAQLGLGTAYYAQRKLDQAIVAWSNIRRSDDSKFYAQAQFNLGNTYKDQGNPEQAIVAWSNIRREEADPGTYAGAQLCLGEVYSLDKETEEQAHEAYDNVRDFSYYKSERGFKILKCPVEVRKNLHTVADNTDEVLKYLQIIPEFESKVAHYSRVSTAFSLLDSKEPSKFRLNTIRGVNDPTEGLVLGTYWNKQGISENIHANDTATFISCFTFNHDSLNQFRLYGKEDKQEATGVSLVFRKKFFSSQLEVIANPSKKLYNKKEKTESNKLNKLENASISLPIDKSTLQTLYRCIYLDPETGYWTLSQRDKSTFYRAHKNDVDMKEKWKKYYNELIPEKEENVEKYLFGHDDSVLSVLQSIFAKARSYNKDKNQKILEAVRFILLPLQYLVKHIAFQEEQECRIMYITQFRDEEIHSNREEQQMYVEYEEPVLPHIDKIYLSPGAAKYQDHFRILLDQGSGKSKVRISQNPFRNKE